MPAPGALHRSGIGFEANLKVMAASGATTFAQGPLNAGYSARFIAEDTRDIKTVYVNFSAVTAAGTVQCRIETSDATTGKPSGSLYDASATKDFTPVTGWQAVTFASLPTAGLTAGTEYHVVLLTTVGGTTHTLRASVASASLPCVTLTAADGTTRSNFAEINNSTPIITLIKEDDVEDLQMFCQFATSATYNLFGTNAAGCKFVVPANVTYVLDGIEWMGGRAGTQADLRIRIFNSSDATVTGSTVTVDKDSLSNSNNRNCRIPFPGLVTLTAGTYRVVFDSSGSANSSNCNNVKSGQARVSALVPSSGIITSTTDVTAGTIVWVDTATEQAAIGLLIDSISGAAGGTDTVVLGRPMGWW